VLLAHRIALDPKKAQAMAWWTSGKVTPFPNEGALRRQLNNIKRVQFPRMFEVSKCAVREAIISLGMAFRLYR
jgi:putative transposase